MTSKLIRNRSSKRMGFTPLELLIVISILALIASLLLPVLSLAKERAVRAGSGSSLRQLSVATLLYVGDNDDVLPPYVNNEALLEAFDPAVTTVGLPTNSRYPLSLKECLGPYLSAESIWFCKNDPFAGTPHVNGIINHQYASYMYWPIPNQTVGLDEYVWPLALSTDELFPNSELFSEVSWFSEKTEVGYWSQPIRQWAGIDGHIGVWHFR